MKTFRCEIATGCSRAFCGLEGDILGQLGEHARHEHGMAELPDELRARALEAMVPVMA